MTLPPVERRVTIGRVPLVLGAVVLSLVPAAALVFLAGSRTGEGDAAGPNARPVAVDDVVTVRGGEPVAIDVIANDRDPDGDGLVVVDIAYESGNMATLRLADNLVSNGDAAAGDNRNFSGFAYLEGLGPNGEGVFATTRSAGVFVDDFIPVDLAHNYEFRMWSKADPNVGATQFAGFGSYDADEAFIGPVHVSFEPGSETELARDLAPGDEEIVLADATNWRDGVGEPGQLRNIVMYPYTDRQGNTYEPYTYSRHVELAPPEGLWEPGSIVDNRIRLSSPWSRPNQDDPDGVWPAGTAVANAHGGATFNYPLVSGESYTSDWEEYVGVVSGVSEGGEIDAFEFRPGTAFIRFGVVANRNAAGSRALYTGISVFDGSVVEYTAAEGFTGRDTFSYTVSDGRGATATATVTVEVVANAEPLAVDDEFVTPAEEQAALDVLGNDSDPDGDELEVVEVTYDSGNRAEVVLGRNLVANGDGTLGDNTNFSAFDFVAGDGPDGEGAFVTDRTAGLFSDEYIPVDATHTYDVEAWSKADPNPGARHFLGLAGYDADRLFIEPWQVAYGPGSETELAEDLAPGDTRIVLASAVGWSNGLDDPSGHRNIVMYPYTNLQGETYEPYTYSRLVEQAPPDGLWAPGAIEGSVIDLLSPWNRPNPGRADGVWPAGTQVANARSGPTYTYALLANDVYTSEWVEHSGSVSGIATGGRIPSDRFRPGTEFVRIVVIANRDEQGSIAHYARFSLLDRTTPIAYQPPAGFAGTDEFSYTVEDGRGGTSTATVSVEVTPNAPPTAVDDSVAVQAGETVRLDPLLNDSDPDGDAFEIVEVLYDSPNGADVSLRPNLIVNGDGSLGDNTNFSRFELVAGAGEDGGPVFQTSETAALFSDSFVPIDVTHAYEIAVSSRADPAAAAAHSLGFAAYDVDQRAIQPWHVAYGPGSETTLAADLAPGDTEIVVADATGWSNDPKDPGTFRNIVMYPYTNSQGETYEPYTYSRLTERAPAEGLWAAGAAESDTIRLRAPWDRPNPGSPDGVWPAGTPVANARSGLTFNFVLGTNLPYTTDWTRHRGTISGIAPAGSVTAGKFPAAAAFVRLAVAANVGATGSVAQYDDFELRDLTAPVVYVPAPGFTGTDTVSYTVEDERGARSTATITIEVGT